mgnify:CR=1 FL=1
MAKKRQRKSRESKGIHGTTRSGKTSTGIQRLLNQLDAYKKGKNVVLTIATKEKNRRLIRVSAKDVWGDLHSAKAA